MASRKKGTSGKAHRFGGDWTSTKLSVLAQYLVSYTTALKDKPSPEHPFKKAYIDAFAGTGYRTMRSDDSKHSPNLEFPDLADPDPQKLLDGSARLALKTQPEFDRYIFIERNKDRVRELESLKTDPEFSHLASRMTVKKGEANREIRALCEKKWSSHRAVLFLDPYGMQVEWETITAIAKTKAIDLWLLFPLGIGVNRLLTRSGDIPEGWQRRLDTLLGTADWRDEFYAIEHRPTLFGGEEHVIKASTETIGRYFNKRLGEVFAGVAEPAGVLRNSSNCPLYLFCFAAANEKGAKVALKIANHLLKDLR